MQRIRESLGRLGEAGSLAELVNRAPLEACRGCGFDRATLFSVRGTEIVAESAHFADDEAAAREFLVIARERPPRLRHPLVEADVVRRRVAMLVRDAQNDRRAIKPFVKAMRTTSYVASPVTAQGRVVGILEADCHLSSRVLDDLDVEILWAFSEGLGLALARAALMERLRSQQDNVHRLLAATLDAVAEISLGELVLDPSPREAATETVNGSSAVEDPALVELLTARELEVFALMATGQTNSDIAARLVISQSTVKSHVKQILRKLGAANRSEAISRYLRGLPATPSPRANRQENSAAGVSEADQARTTRDPERK